MKVDNEVFFACYVFDPENTCENYYIEVQHDGAIEATKGMCTDTIDHILYGDGELNPNKELFISDEEFPEKEFNEMSQMWIIHKYTGPTVKSDTLSHDQIRSLQRDIEILLTSSPKISGTTYEQEGKKLEQDSYGVVLMIEGKTVKWWDKSCTKSQKKFVDLIKNVAPIPILPNAKINCINGEENSCEKVVSERNL